MFIQYEHHGQKVWVDSELKGTHRSHCLCFSCGWFRYLVNGEPRKCERAAELYEFCKKLNMVTPVFECPVFDPSYPIS